jgi:hypothetical protein
VQRRQNPVIHREPHDVLHLGHQVRLGLVSDF